MSLPNASIPHAVSVVRRSDTSPRTANGLVVRRCGVVVGLYDGQILMWMRRWPPTIGAWIAPRLPLQLLRWDLPLLVATTPVLRRSAQRRPRNAPLRRRAGDSRRQAARKASRLLRPSLRSFRRVTQPGASPLLPVQSPVRRSSSLKKMLWSQPLWSFWSLAQDPLLPPTKCVDSSRRTTEWLALTSPCIGTGRRISW